jgi:microcystin-dependent protein
MSSPFVAEIRIFAGNFAPRGWAMCNGQLLAISSNTALFSLIGTYYGGNGTSNFQLPNMQGNAPLHQGTGSGLSTYVLGETTGSETETLLVTQMPSHTHTFTATEGAGGTETVTPGPTVYLAQANPALLYLPPPSQNSLVSLAPQAIGFYGGSQPHQNQQPYLTLNFIIALSGIYPARN